MKFEDIYFSKECRFSVGIEKESGKYYLSIPVTNEMVDYEEYYEISEYQFDSYQKDTSLAADFLKECRSRKNDDLLFLKPGSNRGVAC